MALKDTWIDLNDKITGVEDSGDMASAESINEIAHAVIDLENKPDGEIIVDDALSNTSTNPVQNKVITGAIEQLEPLIIEASLSETFQVTTVKDLATIREELVQAFEDGRQTVLHLTNELDNLTFELYDTARPSDQNTFRLYQTLFLNSNGINSLDIIFDLFDIDMMSVSAHVDELATVEYVDDAIGDIETALDNIIAIQNEILGGGTE